LTSLHILQKIAAMRVYLFLTLSAFLTFFLGACGDGSNQGVYGPPNLGGPTVAERKAKIASEPTGSFYYGRRYYVQKTRFWGYLRKPRQSASNAKLVIFNESKKRNPDRLPEAGPVGQRYGFDQNYEYRIRGYYTGETVYEVNSNQFLPEFMLTGYEVVERKPGWLFSPKDHYNPESLTMRPR